MSELLDDAAAAALYRIASMPKEQIGALYASGDSVARTPTITAGHDSKVRGSLSVPAGSLLALFHNHPSLGLERERAIFSNDDKAQARRLGVPSYISAGDKVMRYDPAARGTEEVLAQIPLEEIRRLYMARALAK